MCVPVHNDHARKCSEARRLKDSMQHKCCISDTRGLYAALPPFVSVRLEDFLPCFSLNSISSRSSNQNVLPVGPRLSPLLCCNERFVVIFIIVSNGSFSIPPHSAFLLVSVLSKEGKGAQKEQIGEWRWIKLFVLWAQVHTVHALCATAGEEWSSQNTDRRTGVAAVDERCCQVWKGR